MVTQQLTIRLDEKELPEIRMVSGDIGREIRIEVYAREDSDTPIDLETYSAEITIIKPDNTFIMDNFDGDEYELPEQAGAVSGSGYYQIKIFTAGSHQIYTGQGPFLVDDMILSDDVIESSSIAFGDRFPEDFATKTWVDDEIAAAGIGTYVAGNVPEEETMPPLVKLQINDDIYPLIHKVDEQEDADITNPAEGDVLTYDADDHKWKNEPLVIPDPTVTKTASGNPIEITDAASAPMVKCVTEIQGSQDLHGYDKPWVGGAGKNKLEVTATSQTINGVTFTVNSDGTVIANGTATEEADFILMGVSSIQGSYIVNGCPPGGSTSTYYLAVQTSGSSWNNRDVGNGVTINNDTIIRAAITIMSGYTANNLKFYPMIRLSTETDSTFTPYSNICPITAYTEGEIEVSGKNMFNQSNPDKWINMDGDLISDTGSIVSQLLVAHPNQEYILSSSNSTSILCICFYDNSMTKLLRVAQSGVGQLTATAPNDSAFMYAGSYKSNNNLQLELGSTATTYEPYVGTTHTTTYPAVIYRGSEDVVNGEVSYDMPVVDLGSLTWTYEAGTNSMFATLSDAKPPVDNDTPMNAVCSISQIIKASDRATITGIRAYMFYNAQQFYIRDSGYTDATAFTTAMTGQTLAYALATPTTTPVTPSNLPIKSLSGYNHIESSTGDMVVEYITQQWDAIMTAAQLDNMKVYSTDEQVIGTWIDGSYLYEKTYTQQLSGYTADIDISNLSASQAWIFDGFFVTTLTTLPLNSSVVNGIYAHVNMGATPPVIALSCMLESNATAYVTIRYTKGV